MTDQEIKEMTERLEKQAEARRIKYPITVTGIEFKVSPPISSKSAWQRSQPGALVKVRSCKKEHGDKTYLGILVGFAPIHSGVEFHQDEKDKTKGSLLFSHSGDNPVIFIPELKECVLGAGSWWGEIENEKELEDITDDTIGNVWYVKLLKEMNKKEKPEGSKGKIIDKKV